MNNGFPPTGQNDRAPLWQRKPRRITITIPAITYIQLIERSHHQGRSISNLSAFLLEEAVKQDLGRGRGRRDHDSDERRAA